MEGRDGPVATRGVRGATTVEDGGPGGLAGAVEELLGELVAANGCDPQDVAAAIFTVTDDLAGTNPPAAARAAGWDSVPLLTVREHPTGVGVARCVRVLLLWNTTRAQGEIRHVYLRGAHGLRPDLTDAGSAHARVNDDVR